MTQRRAITVKSFEIAVEPLLSDTLEIQSSHLYFVRRCRDRLPDDLLAAGVRRSLGVLRDGVLIITKIHAAPFDLRVGL